MKRLLSRVFLSAALIALFGCGQAIMAQGGRTSEEAQTIEQLLKEVRMLRQALQTMQQMSVDTQRSQLLVDRIRVNREDIRRLTDSLNDTRETLAKTHSTIPHFAERQKLLESQAQLEVDQRKKAEYEFEAKHTKEAIERYKASIEPMKEREQQLVSELNAAKAKVEELENRLDLLERAIDSDRQKLVEKARSESAVNPTPH